MLTACGLKETDSHEKEVPKSTKPSHQEKKKSAKEKETKKNYTKIVSNKNKEIEKKRIKVTLPKALNDPRASKDDHKLAQNGIDEYNDTIQKVYKNSITLLSYDGYYDVEKRSLIVLTVAVNNCSKPISSLEFEGNMHITIDSKARVMPGSFKLEAKNYDPIQPGEGTIVPLSFRVLNYTKDTITFSKKEIEGSFYNFKFKELDK